MYIQVDTEKEMPLKLLKGLQTYFTFYLFISEIITTFAADNMSNP